MLNPFGRDNDPGSYVGLQKRILRRLKTGRVDNRILELIQAAYSEALNAENVVLTRAEKKKLQADVLKLVFEDVLQQVRERGEP